MTMQPQMPLALGGNWPELNRFTFTLSAARDANEIRATVPGQFGLAWLKANREVNPTFYGTSLGWTYGVEKVRYNRTRHISDLVIKAGRAISLTKRNITGRQQWWLLQQQVPELVTELVTPGTTGRPVWWEWERIAIGAPRSTNPQSTVDPANDRIKRAERMIMGVQARFLSEWDTIDKAYDAFYRDLSTLLLLSLGNQQDGGKFRAQPLLDVPTDAQTTNINDVLVDYELEYNAQYEPNQPIRVMVANTGEGQDGWMDQPSRSQWPAGYNAPQTVKLLVSDWGFAAVESATQREELNSQDKRATAVVDAPRSPAELRRYLPGQAVEFTIGGMPPAVAGETVREENVRWWIVESEFSYPGHTLQLQLYRAPSEGYQAPANERVLRDGTIVRRTFTAP